MKIVDVLFYALHATSRAINAIVTPIADITVVITHFVSVGFLVSD